MLRLVQGDSSGKTMVAAQAALAVFRPGARRRSWPPTELLAEQHFIIFDKWLTPLGVSQVAWLAGKLKGRTRTPRWRPWLDSGAARHRARMH